ncbi:Protein kinase, putative [Hondaea fermentalgiana]|uniref:Protein kinase, putative n=1 Tax=Hondaea fermentalgiana TaxID=2315210 RepID=A0A2R5GEN6_9STRA|nr:Protein kinase, putative [Hondaea fermentalgiana]|eukprot:GBG29396.1 Protein kinase, putative [Hondaea fermentalgiana]
MMRSVASAGARAARAASSVQSSAGRRPRPFSTARDAPQATAQSLRPRSPQANAHAQAQAASQAQRLHDQLAGRSMTKVIAREYSASPATAARAVSAPVDDLNDGYYLPQKYRRRDTRLRYEIGQELGNGHYATVFEALDTKTGQKVAVKVMDKRTAPREICQNELAILEELSASGRHHRITPIKDVYEDSRRLYFVLELMRGGDFFERISTSGRIPEREAAAVIRKLCFALNALHEHGILHRDVKLENLLLEGKLQEEKDEGEDEAFKLADLGFAKKIDESDAFKNPAGTLGYVAPEVLRDRLYSPACDVWSAGIVLYILLAGYPPFPHKPGVDVAALGVEEQLELELEAIEFGREPSRWREHLQKGVWRDIDPGAKSLVSRMLRLDPSKRYTTKQVLNDPWIVRNSKLRHIEYLNFE